MLFPYTIGTKLRTWPSDRVIVKTHDLAVEGDLEARQQSKEIRREESNTRLDPSKVEETKTELGERNTRSSQKGTFSFSCITKVLGVTKHFTLVIVNNSKSLKLTLLIFTVKIAE